MDDIGAVHELAMAEAVGVPHRWMERPSNDGNTPCIYETDGWRVSTTSERATEECIDVHVERQTAADDFVSSLQRFIRYEELRRRHLGHRSRGDEWRDVTDDDQPARGGRMDDIDAARYLAVAEAAGIGFNWMHAPHNELNVPSIYRRNGR